MAGTTRIKDSAVRVEGLNEMILRLKALETGAEVGIRLANKATATLVANHARSAGASLGGVAAHTAPSLKASAGLKSGSVSLGSDPAAAGAEFGGQGRSTTQQFQPFRGHEGYYLFPTIRRDSDEINTTYREALDRVLREAGLE